MTRNLLTVLLAAVLGFASQPLRATTGTSGLFTYLDDGTTITISGHTSALTGSVVIPATIAKKPVTRIGYQAFEYASGMTSVTIPSSVTSISDVAFAYCSGLTGVTIPPSVTSIGNGAFASCTGLTGVIIPTSVTSMGYSVFESCSGLTRVFIPATVVTMGVSVFARCDQLTAITVATANPNYSSVGGVLFDKARLKLLAYPAGKSGSYTIPTGVTIIGYLAFTHCGKLTGVNFPSSVTTIEQNAFENCTGLTHLTFPGSVTRIMNSAFALCDSLTTATFLGSAPILYINMFYLSAADFQVKFIIGSTGFTTPTWEGYPSEGVAAAPVVDVQYPLGTHLVSGAAKKSFGTVKVGMTSTFKIFTITNIGTAPLTGLAVTRGGANIANFSNTQPVLTTLAPGASTTFKASFKPNAIGTRNATLHIGSNAPTANPFNIALTGMGAP